MDGYTKINGTNKSRSNKFSDLQSLPQPHKTNENLSPNHTVFHDIKDLESISKSQRSKNQEPHDENEKENEDAIANEENMKGNNNNNNNNNNIPNGVKLSRACSVSSAASANRFRLERQGSKSTSTTSSFQSVKRAFSMRRSSSVSEKYCRIHDQGFSISSPIMDDVAEAHEDGEKKKKKKNGSGRILKACKRLFGI